MNKLKYYVYHSDNDVDNSYPFYFLFLLINFMHNILQTIFTITQLYLNLTHLKPKHEKQYLLQGESKSNQLGLSNLYQ